ncbi:hypothetical protein B0S91_2301 [Caldicellulosiruptor bescii]|nr:hypothetical protein B0S87_1398 [Caldicellulosiruptor bescii]PBD05085.1 hypothetical protein B0S85_2811 [Caldicellulosiruptor bescii]PFH16202.1 hypothetical protein B0S88_2756 [Caldicellulosiruptor bescii]PFH23208.1 hypothetical protein B0S91_2301 [Caldicellulosiruptor bescii]SKC45303.1 hypothetical protein SAMN05216512_0377 [Caldicellulosiruptor bescii]
MFKASEKWYKYYESLFFEKEAGIVMNNKDYKNKNLIKSGNSQTILDFVEKKLLENAAIRELMKDEYISFGSIRDFLYFKFCPLFFGLCPYKKNEKDSFCDTNLCWLEKLSDIDSAGEDYDHQFFHNLVKLTVQPSICPECGEDNLELKWQDEGYLAKLGLINFADVAYLECKKCKKRLITEQDKMAVEFLLKVFLAKPSKKSPVKAGQTVVLALDKAGLEIFIKHLEKEKDVKTIWKRLDPFSISDQIGELDLNIAVADFMCEYYNIDYEEKNETDTIFEEFEVDDVDSEKFDISDLFDDFDEK